jgi:riboflavin kinase/FMN adenylyltransferase
MDIYRRIEKIPKPGPLPAALTLGCFDGVHIAHRKIIRKVVERKGADCGSAGLITFAPCPVLAFCPEPDARCLITPLEEKLDLLEQTGLDWVLLLPFDSEMQRVEAEEFVSRILVEKLNAGAVVAGHDVGFGHKRRGDAALLRDQGRRHTFKVQVLDPVTVQGEVVSSSAVRRKILDCDFSGAAAMLGRPYSITGPVVRGNRLGRTIGVPTANLEATANKLLPPDGVYAARVRYENSESPAVFSIGVRPTVDNTGTLALEAHILDASPDLYDQIISIEPAAFIREQKKFDSIEELKHNIHQDIACARRILSTPAP